MTLPTAMPASAASGSSDCRLQGLLELAAVQILVEAAPGEKLLVGALLHDPAAIHDQDGVGVADRRGDGR